MDVDIFGRKRKKKSAVSPVEALYNGTLTALQDLDFSSQIYHPNLFKSYEPSIKINTNEDEPKDEIPKTSTYLEKKIFHFETDVGLVKSPSSRNLQFYQGKTPLKLGTSRNLSVSQIVLEKLEISLVKPVTSFGFGPIFVPTPFRNTKLKSTYANKRKRIRKKKTELPASRFPGLDDPIPDTSEDKKYVSENIFEVKAKIDNYPIKDSSDSPPNISGDIYIPQNRTRKYIECSEANQEISKNEANKKTSKPPKPKTSSSTITAEFLRAGEEPLDFNYMAIQRIEREQEKLKNEIEQLSLQVKEHSKAKMEQLTFSKTETETIGSQAKELQKYSTTIDASENSLASVPNNEPQKSKSNIKKDKSIVPCASETKQQTCEPKLTCAESTSVKTTRPSHLRKQIKPQKNKNPGLILLSSISETSRKDSLSSNQPVWDRTARPRFNINLQPISTEAQRSETKISETSISAQLPEVAPKQEVLVKIQATGTKILRPCINVEMQSVSSEANISVDEGVPDVNKSRSAEVLPSETTKKVQSSKKGFKIPSNLLRETTSKDEAVSSKLEILDSKQKPRPRPSYSTQSKSAKPYKLTYEEITPPEVTEAISAKESQSPSSDKDDKGQPILRLRLDPNLPEPRPRENLLRPKPIRVAPIDAPRTPYQNVYPEKHNSQSDILWKNVSYVVDSFADPEEISSREKLPKFLPPLKKDYTKLKKISSPSSDTSKSPKLPSSPPEPNGSRKVESPIQRTKKQTKKVKKLPRNQPEPSESLKLVSPLPKPKKQPQASEVCKSESLSSTQEQKNAQSVSSKNRKLKSSPTKSNNKAVKTQGTPCTQSESSGISKSESPSSRPSANRGLASPTPGPSRIRKLASTSGPSGSGRLASPTSEPSGNRRLVSPPPGPSGIRKIASTSGPSGSGRLASPTSEPSGNRRLVSPPPGPSGIRKLAFPTPGASEIYKSPTSEPERICKSSPSMPGSSKICLSGTPALEPSEICTPLTPIPEPREIRTSTAPTPEPSAIRTSSSSTLEPSKSCTSSEASEIPTSSTPAPKLSEIRWSSTPTTEPSEIRTSVSRKSTSRASKSRSSAFHIPGPRGICKSSNILGSHKISKKSFSSRYKQAVQFKRSSFTQFELISPPQEPCDKPKYSLPTQSESSGCPKSASPPQDSSTAQIESLSPKPKTQTAKRRSPYTQTDPSGSHKPMSPSSDSNVMSELAASPPEESSESRQVATGSSDSSANLEKLPFPPPQPAGFRNLSRKVRFQKKRSALYDERGIHIESGKDICDCLVPNCKGCFNPCTKCRSTKCGLSCRVHRKYEPDEEYVD